MRCAYALIMMMILSNTALAADIDDVAKSGILDGVTEFRSGDKFTDDNGHVITFESAGVWTSTSGADIKVTRYDDFGNFIEQTENGISVNRNAPHGGWMPSDNDWNVGRKWSLSFKKYRPSEPGGYGRKRSCKIKKIVGEYADIKCRNQRLDRDLPAYERFVAHVPTKFVLLYRSREFNLSRRQIRFERSP